MRRILKLSAHEQDEWLDEHLPNRVCAAWVYLPGLPGEWQWEKAEETHKAFLQVADPNQVWCIDRAVEHGRKTALRWLIEFVGIRFGQNGPDRPRSKSETDVSIQSFVTDRSDWQVPIDKSNPNSNAWVLARIWKASSQSSSHSTFKTNHPAEDPAALAPAFRIVVEHLQEKLYQPRGKRLSTIVKGYH